MAALAPTPPLKTIRVYCPTHKVGFTAAPASLVQCGSHKHTFSTNFIDDCFWEYCCDCQHYWPLDAAKGNIAADECPACERELVRRFVCEHCQVVSVESDSPGRRKEFSISAAGVPQPSCPGCLHKPRTTTVQHDCADFGVNFITTRATCPFCDDPLAKAENGWLRQEPGTIEIKPEEASEQRNAFCGKCGTSSAPGHAFCKRCGSSLKLPKPVAQEPLKVAAEPALNPIADTADYFPLTTQTVGSSYPWKPIVGVAGGLAAIGIIVTVILFSVASGNPVEKKLERAITLGNLFGPDSENAHALYLELKNSGASEQKLRPYRERILPRLTDRPLQMITDFMVPGSDEVALNEWQDAARSLGWAAELKPEDKKLRARSLYADGRIAYLSKNEDLAISIWTRAGEADSAWPLPINGIGLIYTGRKDYATARRYYQAAIQRDANWAYPYNNMGTAYFMEKNYSDAKSFYQKAVQLAPRWARPHSWLGDIAMKEGDYNTAIAEFTLALDTHASGTKNMNLDKIREQLALAQQRAASSF